LNKEKSAFYIFFTALVLFSKTLESSPIRLHISLVKGYVKVIRLSVFPRRKYTHFYTLYRY